MPGSYEIVAFGGFTPPQAGTVDVWVLDYRDTTYWYSDGVSGALDGVWHDVSLQGIAGSRTSEEGWRRCVPE